MSAALTVEAAIVGPSAAEGHYKGEFSYTSGPTIGGVGASAEVRIFVSATSAELFIDTSKFGSKLSPSHFAKIRRGVFNVVFTLDGEPFNLTGRITESGNRISGTFSTHEQTGTFIVTKYAG